MCKGSFQHPSSQSRIWETREHSRGLVQARDAGRRDKADNQMGGRTHVLQPSWRWQVLQTQSELIGNCVLSVKSRDIPLPTKVYRVKGLMVFPLVMYGCESWIIKKSEHEELMLLNWCCGAGEDSWGSPGLQGEPTSSLQRKSVLNIHWKDWCWSWNSNALATCCEESTHLKWPWCWERLKAGGEGGDRGWDGWMASLTQWTWVWANSGR